MGRKRTQRARSGGTVLHLQRRLWDVTGEGTEAGGQQLMFGEYVHIPRTELDTACVVHLIFQREKGQF